jgi:hypothetical protein
MSTENEELFEGLQIMTPSELNSAVAESNKEETGEEEIEVDEPQEVITPVEKTTKIESTESSAEAISKTEAVYKGLMKELVNAGILTAEDVEKLDELPGTLDSIKSLVDKTVKTNFKKAEENWKKSMPSVKKRFLEIEDAFDETDQAILMAQRLEFFDSIDNDALEKDVTLQKQVYFDLLKSKNFSDQDAMEAIEDAESVGKLADKALKAIPELKNQAQGYVKEAKAFKEERTKAEIEAQNKAFENLISNIESRDAFIDGLNLNKVAKDRLKGNILNPVFKDDAGQEYNSLMYKQKRNPVEFEMLINYYDTIGLFNLDKQGKFKPDISKLKNVAKTAAVNELDKIISSEEQRGVGRNTSVETSQKTEGLLSMLESAFTKK